MKHLLTLCIFLSLCIFATAQNVAVRIALKNESNEALSNATVQILRVKDSSLFIVKTIKADAYFSLPANSKWFVKITSTQISDIFRLIEIPSHDTLMNFIAATKSKNLDAVVITSKKPLIKQEDDKTVIDADVLAESSTNAYEVLEKTPGALVDQDGNVYLNSATPAIIYINGREIKLSATDLASLLKSLPANSISKVEILRSPSAKYDAAGSGGIVNIVLKKGVKIGLNGSAEATHFQGKYPTNSGGFNLNNSANKLNTYLSANVTRRTNYELLSSDRPVNNILFSQSSYTRYPNLNYYFGGGADYEINKKWTVGYDARFVGNRNRSRAQNDINIDSLTSGIGENISVITNNGPSFYSGNNFSSRYKIDSTGSEWTNSFDYNIFRSTNDQDYSNIYILPAKNTLNGDGNTRNRKNIVSFKSDLIYKLANKITLETGLKLNYSTSRNSAVYFADSGNVRYADIFQTNNFKYRENIFALYLQGAKSFGQFTLKPGVRLETTDIQGRQIFPKDTTFSIRRTDLFPYVYLRHPLFKIFGFQLVGNAIYRRSITRPYYEALNPYPKYIDQYTYDIGNPALQPQFTNNYEINVTADEFPIFSLGVNEINNIFTSLTYQKNLILYRTFDNLGKNKEVYLRLVGGIPPGNKYFFYAGGQMNAVDYKGFYNNVPFTYKNTSWTFFMYHNFKPIPTLNIGVNGFMRTNSVVNFFELKTFGGLAITANKSILNKKMNVVLAVNDLLKTNRNEFSISQPGFLATGVRYGDTRRVGLTVRYNFGSRPKEEKKVSFEAPAEAN